MSAPSFWSAQVATATREAAQWHVLQRQGALGAAEQQRFMDWLVASPNHLREYLAIASVAAELAEAMRDLPIDVAAGDGAPSARAVPGNNVVALPVQRALTPIAPVRRRPRMRHAAVAAMLLLAVGVGLHLAWPQSREYITAHGAPRVITLDDGTVMHLNAESRVSARLGWWARRVELTRGQASFVVAEDRRPFTVHAADLQVRDIGTTFDVSLQRAQARVGVTEGRVQLVDDDDGRLLADLRAGQSARVGYRDRSVRVIDEEAGTMTAWWQRRLVFRDEPLGDVADQFNRMNRVQLRVDDDAAAALRLTGNLRVDDLESLRAFLAQHPALVMSARRDGIHVRSRRAGATGAR